MGERESLLEMIPDEEGEERRGEEVGAVRCQLRL